MEKGEVSFDLVEVMACTGGCIAGAGQPHGRSSTKRKRAAGLYSADRLNQIKSSEDNPSVTALYTGLLKGRSHDLLHVHYGHHE